MALNNLCYCYKWQNRNEKSIEVGLQALAAADKAGAGKLAAFVRGNLGSSYALLGDFESAYRYQSEAVRLYEATGARLSLTRGLGELGLLFDLQGDFPKAISYYQRAFQIATELHDQRDLVRFAENLSTTLIKSGEWDQAAEWNRKRAADLSLAAKQKDAVPFRQRNQAHIEYGRGNLDEAARICHNLLDSNPQSPSIVWATYNLLGVIEARQGQAKKAAGEFETALRIIDSNTSRLLNEHYRITLLSRLIPFYREYVDFLVEQNDDAGALRVVESSRARVLAERLERETEVERFRDVSSAERFARGRTGSRCFRSMWRRDGRSRG